MKSTVDYQFTTYKKVMFISSLFLIGSLSILGCLIVYGNKPQVYDDIVIEMTSILASNKSIEINLLYTLILCGIALYTGYYYINKKNSPSFVIDALNKRDTALQNEIENLPLLYFCSGWLDMYAINGIYRLYTHLGGNMQFSYVFFVLISMTLFLLSILLCRNKRTRLYKYILIKQIFIPNVLLIYLVSKYNKNGEIFSIEAPTRVKIFIYTLIFIFSVEAMRLLLKLWKKDNYINYIITLGTCVSIMALNNFTGTGAIMSSDLHHPFENIIGYSQVFELGQKLFTQYIPVSGLYSILHGAIFKFFGNGEFGNYYITNNIFFLIVIFCITFLLRMQLNSVYTLLVSIVFTVVNYNRIAFLLPIMLLLISPQLVERKGLWLFVWFVTSLFQGLYYPLYGAATCIALLPLGLVQLKKCIAVSEFKRKSTKLFWGLSCIFCIFLFLISIPYLLGTYEHVKAMAQQTLLADGISRFYQSIIPLRFESVLGKITLIVTIFYYVLTWMIPVLFVWLPFALALEVDSIQNPEGKYAVFSLSIMPMIAYSYTFVRLDFARIYARNTGILLCIMVLLVVISYHYFTKKVQITAIVVCMIFCITVSIGERVEQYLTGQMSKMVLMTEYEVPKDFDYIHDTDNRLGTGFISKGMYTRVKRITADKKHSYFSLGGFGDYYLNEIRGDSVMEHYTVRGFDATIETIKNLRKNHSRVGMTGWSNVDILNIFPLCHYYLYHWLMTSGEYVYSSDIQYFIPNTTFVDVKKQHHQLSFGINQDIGNIPHSLGLSITSLEKILITKNIKTKTSLHRGVIDIKIADYLLGDEADFFYVVFPKMDTKFEYTFLRRKTNLNNYSEYAKFFLKKNYNIGLQVELSWGDDDRETHKFTCSMGQGKLLIPLGAGVKWLLHKHDYLSIRVLEDGREINITEMPIFRFFKLREVR